MKNRRSLAYAGVLCVFVIFLAGFFIGRNTGGGLRVVTSQQPTQTQAGLQSTETEAEKAEQMDTAAMEPEFPIDLNTADMRQIQELPGIGPVLADRIMAYREANGGFSAVEDLLQVEGIGEKRLESILDYVVVEDQQ